MSEGERIIKKVKVVLVGGVGVGKTSIVYRFAKGDFNEKVQSTIGASFLTKKMKVENYEIEFAVWDTAGQEQYHSLVPLYFRKAACVIVVYDITQKESFFEAKNWINELDDQAPKGVIIALLGNKSDLNTIRKVKKTMGEALGNDKNAIFQETSAKENCGITEVFKEIGRRIVKKYESEGFPKNEELKKKFSSIEEPKRTKKCTCD